MEGWERERGGLIVKRLGGSLVLVRTRMGGERLGDWLNGTGRMFTFLTGVGCGGTLLLLYFSVLDVPDDLTGVGCGVRGVASWQDVITDGSTEEEEKPPHIISSSSTGWHHLFACHHIINISYDHHIEAAT